MGRNAWKSGVGAVAVVLAGCGMALAGGDNCAVCRGGQRRVVVYEETHPRPYCGPVRKLVWWAKKPKTTHVHLGVCGWQFDSRTRLLHAD